MMHLAYTTTLASMAAQSGDDVNMVPVIIFMIISVGITLITIAGIWKLFEKAGHPGWKSLVPIYNVILWLEMIGRPGWYLISLFVPGLNAILWVILAFGTARSFGRGIPFALGMTLLPFVFIPILGFGQSEYIGGMGPSYRRGPKIA